MGFETVLDLDCTTSTALGGFDKKTKKDNPTKAEGYYLGSRQVESKKAKTGFAYLHVLQTPKGNLGIWGKTDLDRKLTSVTPGTMVRISFTGMQETKNNPMYKYKVEIDKTNMIDVGSLADGGDHSDDRHASASSDEQDDGAEESDIDEEEQLDEQPAPRTTAPKQAAKAPDADRQAKVKALLNRGKSL